jgi:LEA14-like dessication related protein
MKSISLRYTLLVAVVLLGACATLPGASDFDPPTVELAGIRPAKSDGLEARFDLSLRVVNPNTRELVVEGVYYELYVQGKKLLTGANSEPVTIPAYSEGRVDVSGVASLFGSIALLANLMDTRPETGVDYELKAKVSIAGMPRAVRVSHAGSFGARE